MTRGTRGKRICYLLSRWHTLPPEAAFWELNGYKMRTLRDRKESQNRMKGVAKEIGEQVPPFFKGRKQLALYPPKTMLHTLTI